MSSDEKLEQIYMGILHEGNSPNTPFQSNKEMGMRERVRTGKEREDKIYRFLKPIVEANGDTTRLPTPAEDMHDKIDFFIVRKNNGGEDGVQIKYRDDMPDVLMELMKPFKPNIVDVKDSDMTGRDMKGNAKFYAVLSPDRTKLYWCAADTLKAFAKQAAKGFFERRKYGIMDKTFKYNPNIMLKVAYDPKSLEEKLMGFFNPLFVSKHVIPTPKNILD